MTPTSQHRPLDPLICIHGMFRSGTNFAKALLELNYACRVEYDLLGWKHSFYPLISKASRLEIPDIPSVVITKNPLNSLFSIYNYMLRNPGTVRSEADSLSSFIRSRLIVTDPHAADAIELRFSSGVDYWNAMNWNLLSASSSKPRCFHLRYEDLLDAPQEALAPIVRNLGLDRRASEFTVPANRMRNLESRAHDREKFTFGAVFNRQAVQERKYLQAFTDADLRFVIEHLDKDLLARSGYDRLIEDAVRGRS